ncbi:ribonucleoprotein PTB-binding 2 isoform X2 [Scyliorhinus canicula]|uniref:ribonucleoprotein PTB-binding 2 isoform X2 n=1 Tax=Scyliorhinus canicula TaxID=7830 RepID=UPI0018F7B9F9|nr:ribonucleoprotein PTB-binding 2 isoform X2 [Scyliorhinus canicula]
MAAIPYPQAAMGSVFPSPQGEERLLPTLEPEEIERRLQRTRMELSNRRKILVKNLRTDSNSQEVHELLKDYELKYCYVDKNKGTAFVTLLNGEQAQDAIQKCHKSSFQGREISVQLQPTDTLLCITQLPLSYTQQQFEELVRLYGNLERCFLVYNETTGHSKGYGFVEYMKKDSAARAKSELMGKQLGPCILYVQWTDVDHLSADFLHSKCLCIDKIAHDYKDGTELTQLFSQKFAPVFCQLAQASGSHPSFAVAEYETADQTEFVQRSTDGIFIGGIQARVSFCAPGPAGRCTLAALIAAQRLLLNSRKGLLPEPSPLQIINSLGNPAALPLLLRPYFQGHAGKKSILGNAGNLPVLPNPVLTATLLQMNQTQNAVLGNGLFQNLLRMQVAQQQQLLLSKENPAINNKPSLLGDPSVLLQAALGLGPATMLNPGKGILADSPKGISVPVGTLPFHSNQKFLGQDSTEQKALLEKSSIVIGPPPVSASVAQAHLQGIPNSILGSLITSHQKQHSQSNASVSGAAWSSAANNQTSLLGIPPPDLKMPNNPYLNFCNILPNLNLPVGNVTKHTPGQQHAGVLEYMLNPAISRAVTAPELLQTSASQYTFDCYPEYASSCGEYSQNTSVNTNVDYSMAVQVVPSYYAANQTYFPGSMQSGQTNKGPPCATAQQSLAPGAGILGPAPVGNPMTNFKSPVTGQKRASSYLLPSPEVSPDGGYVGQHSQGLGGHYADSYYKKKRIF